MMLLMGKPLKLRYTVAGEERTDLSLSFRQMDRAERIHRLGIRCRLQPYRGFTCLGLRADDDGLEYKGICSCKFQYQTT
jgi:hypothetical protein